MLGAWRAALDELGGRALHVHGFATALAAILTGALAALAFADARLGVGQHGALLGQTGELLQGPEEAAATAAAAERRKTGLTTLYTLVHWESKSHPIIFIR